MENKCKECYENDKTPDENDCKKCQKVIIDDVDVSGCVYYNPQNDTGEWNDLTCERDNAPAFRCDKIKNCYYKQLKRLEQENKKLKEALEGIREMAIDDCVHECSNNSENCTIGSCLEKRIQRKINEVLKDG